MCIYVFILIYIYIGGLMEYISKKSCSIWTVCPCYYMYPRNLPEHSILYVNYFEKYTDNPLEI